VIQPTESLHRALSFLQEIGLPWQWSPGAAGFIPGVDIQRGELLVDAKARASAVLHEAGHLAVIPGEFRRLVCGNVDGAHRLMFEQLAHEDPDSPRMRAALQCSDGEATAWAWAAGIHCGIPDGEIIQDDEYDGEGAILRVQLRRKAFVGINGLCYAGFAAQKDGDLQRLRGLPVYPKLGMWLQRSFA
jgi:hypothetical protein